jgi:hypothetical protein
MSGNSQFFLLTLLAGFVTIIPVRGQPANRLAGRWQTTVPAEPDTFTVTNGDTTRFKGRSAYTAIFEFKPDNHGSIWWTNSAKVQLFTYRLVNSKLIEMQSAGQKPWRHIFTIRNNKLSLGEYPAPKEPQESIAILYTLTFVKQP